MFNSPTSSTKVIKIQIASTIQAEQESRYFSFCGFVGYMLPEQLWLPKREGAHFSGEDCSGSITQRNCSRESFALYEQISMSAFELPKRTAIFGVALADRDYVDEILWGVSAGLAYS